MDDRTRFDALYREHAAAVTRYVRRRCEAQGSDDVVADVFVVAWRRRDELPEDVLPWLLAVARRVLANRRRASARREALQERISSEPAPPPAWAQVGDGELRAATREALRSLSPGDREVSSSWPGRA
jgi:RNA polymerase sigma-70 factor (ECF subfamily)